MARVRAWIATKTPEGVEGVFQRVTSEMTPEGRTVVVTDYHSNAPSVVVGRRSLNLGGPGRRADRRVCSCNGECVCDVGGCEVVCEDVSSVASPAVPCECCAVLGGGGCASCGS